MVDMLNTGVSGLLAAQVGLSTVGHNVANVNTNGYSRQQVSFGTALPQGVGGYFIGSGVNTVAVQRAYSQFLNTSLWSATSSSSRADTMAGLTGQINNQLSGSSNLQTSLDSFFGAVNDTANAPSDTASRQVLLARAGGLVSTFQSLSGQFNQLSSQVQQQIGDAVNSINSYSDSIAKLNGLIRSSVATGGTPPSDLLDKRDALVKDLAAQVGITVVPQNDNTINVFVGNGQALVSDTQSYPLATAPNVYDATRQEVVGAASGSVLSGRISGGALGALMDFRSSVLDPAQTQLGRTAQALASAFNAQHMQGVDLNGDVGGQFFSVAGPTAQAASSNNGTGNVDASISDISKLTGADYTLSYAGGAWSLRDTNGNNVAMGGTGTAADPFTAGGLSMVVPAGAVAGDSFRIQPSRNAAASLAVVITNPDKVAAAAPLAIKNGINNTGTATASASLDGGALSGGVVQFTSATTYTVDGGAVQTYTPGQPINANGWNLQLSGTPQNGDSFTLTPNSNAQGDNTNALMLGKVANLGVLNGGVTSVGGAYSQLVGQVGSAGAVANDEKTTQTAVYNQAYGSQQSVSGVNLDEEAANLVRFQQAYQASAQVITTANSMFTALLSAVQG
ncbi:flagellar hook-associated protein FlgK [Rhodanobacter ginsenosidimutans]|uniref:Flagellar hook-associated protein 1 n=1 Tax=Rhodanobacter ginsenosidimutans TaxID=490571 RepID=A0ABW0JX79_9GAMM